MSAQAAVPHCATGDTVVRMVDVGVYNGGELAVDGRGGELSEGPDRCRRGTCHSIEDHSCDDSRTHGMP